MKKFLIKCAVFCGIISLFFCPLFFMCLFVVNPSARTTMMDELNFKIDRLAGMPSPKIIIIGGSNCSHGIDSELIEDTFGIQTINMGLHASMGLAYHLQSIDPYVHAGDYVLIIPEYSHFTSCLGREELLMVISDVRPNERQKLDLVQWAHLVQYMPSYGYKKMRIMLRRYLRHETVTVVPTHDYGFYGYNEHGDMIKSRNDNNIKKEFEPYKWADPQNIGSDCISRINSFISRHKDATVIILPPSLQDKTFDNQLDYIKRIDRLLIENGTPFLASPFRYRMRSDECWDTPYHLNGRGIQRRTKQLIEDLRPVILTK